MTSSGRELQLLNFEGAQGPSIGCGLHALTCGGADLFCFRLPSPAGFIWLLLVSAFLLLGTPVAIFLPGYPICSHIRGDTFSPDFVVGVGHGHWVLPSQLLCMILGRNLKWLENHGTLFS